MSELDPRSIIQRLLDEQMGRGLHSAQDWEGFRVLSSVAYYLFWGESRATAAPGILKITAKKK